MRVKSEIQGALIPRGVFFMKGWTCKKGFTLIEALMVVVIFTLLLLIAIPAWNDFIRKKQLITAMEGLYDTLKIAHSESIRRETNITVAFTKNITTENWCYALSDGGDCDCLTGVCTIEGVGHVINGVNGINLEITNLTSNKYVTFEGIRGLASDSGSVTLTSEPYSITISVNKLGLLRTCSNTVVGYGVCS